MAAVHLELLALMPTSYRQCTSCETLFGQSGIGDKVKESIATEYPAEFRQEHERLSEWVLALIDQYGAMIRIRPIDPQSGLGLWKSLRHRVRRYPTFIVNGWVKVTGWDRNALDAEIRRVLAAD